MDPLSILASTGTLVTTTGRLLKFLHQLHGTVQDAPLLLSSMTSECTIVYTSLSVLQDLQLKRSRQLYLQSDNVSNALELALLSCAQILSVIEKDVKSCLKASKSPRDADAINKMKLILSKDHLQELVLQLRGQQQALTLLMSTLQRSANSSHKAGPLLTVFQSDTKRHER
jgi:hypothetical protein